MAKYEIIMVLFNYSYFQYCDSNIELFPVAPSKVIALNCLCLIFGFFSIVIALFCSLATPNDALIDIIDAPKIRNNFWYPIDFFLISK